ncbi:MAG: hypothetical protein C4520_02160 [Candidatus Abyssobacteria bacterium SURF_5]|uniref:Uncharacterized protein n=1 Tax=Abyssobacteria bacterium (strain SURF_5) TaxID=2093360 RepID=A0A3A4PCN3_ABYX5|nr:MAG: hypothetical protein C4520_02160 [Candidatus Abyssubacteria bacterium SURF_5]
MLKGLWKNLYFLITVALIFQFGCGTLLYPERRGQRSGRIDPGVAILDGVGLLLFVIPGLIAFAIDFSTGAIYLPGTARGSWEAPEMDNVRQVRFDPEHSSLSDIEGIIKKETGCEVKFGQDTEVFELNSVQDMVAHLSLRP